MGHQLNFKKKSSKQSHIMSSCNFRCHICINTSAISSDLFGFNQCSCYKKVVGRHHWPLKNIKSSCAVYWCSLPLDNGYDYPETADLFLCISVLPTKLDKKVRAAYDSWVTGSRLHLSDPWLTGWTTQKMQFLRESGDILESQRQTQVCYFK